MCRAFPISQTLVWVIIGLVAEFVYLNEVQTSLLNFSLLMFLFKRLYYETTLIF